MSGDMSSPDKVSNLENEENTKGEDIRLEVLGETANKASETSAGADKRDDRVPCGVEQDELLIKDRDPYHWHDQVKIKFEDIFGEPDVEVHSFDTIWHTSNKMFTLSKYWCYRVTSLVLAIPLSLIWGVGFACVTFARIWCCVPCLKSCDIELHCVRRLCEITLRSLVAPCFEAAGRVFYHVRLRVIRGDIETA